MVAQKRVTLKELTDSFVKNSGGKPGTKSKFSQVCNNLLAYWPDSKDIGEISEGDAKCWREWMLTSGNVRDNERNLLGENTVRRRTGIAKQIFNFAISHGWVDKNPFVGLPASVRENPSRDHYVEASTIESLIKLAECDQFKAVLSLARFGGLRCPSEVVGLTWGDVDFTKKSIRIISSKTEHHADGGLRLRPMFPELVAPLEKLRDLATASGKAGAVDPVISLEGSSEAVFRRRLERLLKRAKVEPWPKLFQNMRDSRLMDLAEKHPLKDVCSWLGNSPEIAAKFYLQTRDSEFAKAIGVAQTGGAPLCATVDQEAPVPEVANDDCTKKPKEIGDSLGFENLVVGQKVGEEGLEPPTSTL